MEKMPLEGEGVDASCPEKFASFPKGNYCHRPFFAEPECNHGVQHATTKRTSKAGCEIHLALVSL